MELVAETYKQTEVGLIPSDWEIKTISQLSNPVRGGSPRPAGDPRYFNGNFIPWLTVAALTNIPLSQMYVSETETYLTEEGSVHSRILEKETLIIANSGATLGVPKILAIKCCANDGIAALLDFDKETNKQYLVYFINTQIKYLREVVATGNGQPNLNTGLIGNIKVPLPPTFEEQTAIATALSDADALINSLEKLIAKKRNIKQGAMQKLLQPKEGWEVKKLGDVATIVRGASPRPIEDPKWFDENSPIGWVRISDVTKSVKILTETTQKLSELGIQSSRYVDEGNLIMSICATVGRPILTRINVCIHDGFVVFRNPTIEINYLYYFLCFIENDWSKNGQTGSQMNLNTTLINTTEIPIPPTKEEQAHIANILSEMDAEINALETKLEKFRNVKLGMMQNLLTGKIRLV